MFTRDHVRRLDVSLSQSRLIGPQYESADSYRRYCGFQNDSDWQILGSVSLKVKRLQITNAIFDDYRCSA